MRTQNNKEYEANDEVWFRYYFPNFYTSESAEFHLKSTQKVMTEYYLVRSWDRELSKSGPHILKKEGEKRFEYGTEVKNILTKPDEIWRIPDEKNPRIYIKYYEQGIIKLVVDDKLEVVTLYLTDNKHEGELNRTRKGILLYRQ